MKELLLEHLRETNPEKAPSVPDLKKLEGLKDVTAAIRDEAWAEYQAELAAASNKGDGSTPPEGDKGESGTPPENGEGDKKDTTTTTATTEDDTIYVVTVKKEGFRRLGRAWPAKTEEVALTEDQFAILEADPMFTVVAK